MGTNFYLKAVPPCETCGRSDDALHIGKSSAGWCFSLHVHPDLGINTLEDWEIRWSKPGAIIENEYGDVLSPDEMLKTIALRSWKNPQTDPVWLAENEATPGPHGLARHQIGRYCIGHGDRTYDLIVGDFS